MNQTRANADLKVWEVKDVLKWLLSINMGRYSQRFGKRRL